MNEISAADLQNLLCAPFALVLWSIDPRVMRPFVFSPLFFHTSSLGMSCSSTSSPCCPPGSWDAPLNPSGPTVQPRGQLATIGDKSKTPIYYVCGKAEQEGAADQRPNSGLIVFPDVWGLKNLRTQLICDTFASNNHHVVLFDPFRGETKADHDDMVAWLSSMPYEPNVIDDVNACMDYLVDKGVDRGNVSSVGFCWGCWAIAKCSADKSPFRCAVWAHPSTGIETRVFQQDDDHMMRSMGDSLPILVMPAGNDDDRLKNGGEWAEELIKKHGGKVVDFLDMVHGWTTRSDTSIPKVRQDTEKALSLTIEFINELSAK